MMTMKKKFHEPFLYEPKFIFLISVIVWYYTVSGSKISIYGWLIKNLVTKNSS